MCIKNSYGFSLIELMVVIAIVALLSAVAVPSYTDYMTKVKIVSGVSELESLRNAVKEYYSVHGIFPELDDLGISSPVPATYSEYYAPHLVVVGSTPDNNYTCPVVLVSAYISHIASDPDYNYVDNAPADVVFYNEGIIEKDSILQSKCFYHYYQVIGNAPALISGDFIPGCVNLLDNPTYDLEVEAFYNSC